MDENIVLVLVLVRRLSHAGSMGTVTRERSVQHDGAPVLSRET